MLSCQAVLFLRPSWPRVPRGRGQRQLEHVFSNHEPATVYSTHLQAYSAEGASQDSASIHASTMGSSE